MQYLTLLAFILFAAVSNAATLNVPSSYATVQLAMAAAQPGDTVLLAAGTYNERVDTVRNGSSGSRITVDGQGVATIRQIDILHSYITLKDVTIKGVNVDLESKVYVMRNAHYLTMDGVTVDAENQVGVYGINWQSAVTPPFGTGDVASDCLITGCMVKNIAEITMLSMEGDRNIVQDSVFRDGLNCDFIRLWGRNSIIRRNQFLNGLAGGSTNHPDFIQTFGNNGYGSQGHIIERNLVKNVPAAQMGQLSGQLLTTIGDWTFRNNIFIDIGLGLSCTIPDMKFYNNIWVRANFVNGGPATVFTTRWYERWSIHSSVPDKALTTVPIASGNLVLGARYIVYPPLKTSGQIIEGAIYQAVIGAGESITYNGVTYTSDGIPSSNSPLGTFTGVAGVTTFTTVGSVDVYARSYIRYEGVDYYRNRSFLVTGPLTYTTNDAATEIYRMLPQRAHGVIMKGNAFIDCGNTATNRGGYSIDTDLTGVVADYNYIGKNGFGPIDTDSLQRAVGDAGGWDWQKWWEPNGINGGDPGFTNFSTLDLTLTSSSILKDVGINIASVTDDYAGVARPQNTTSDIGPYEYDDGDTPPPVDNNPPTAPTGFSATASPSSSSITLAWTDASANETGFEIERSLDANSWIPITTEAADAEIYINRSLSPATVYYYRLRSVNTNGGSAWVTANATTYSPSPPAGQGRGNPVRGRMLIR